MQSSFDVTGLDHKKGQKGEQYFFDCARKMGMKPTKSTQDEDRNDHIDFWVTGSNDVVRSVDVKGSKRYTEDQLFLVEIRNVNGDHGWLFGKAYLIAFQYKNRFLVVKREDLVKLVCDLAKVTVSDNGVIEVSDEFRTTERPAVAPMHYVRSDRPAECITYITMKQLLPIKFFVV